MILVTPELDVPYPDSLSPQEAQSLHEKARAAFKTVEFMQENGMEVPAPTRAEKKDARALFMDSPAADPEIDSSGKALMLKALLDEYDVEVVRNAAQLRGYIKLKLIELSDQGREGTQLKALELLGKMSDVQAFAEHVQVNVTHQTTEQLQQTLAQKLSTYLHEVIDVQGKPVLEAKSPEAIEDALIKQAPAVQVIDLDKELGRIGGELSAEPDETGGKEEDFDD